MTTSPWLPTAAAAAYAGVHENTLYRAVADGRLSAARTGRRGRLRFRAADLDEWLDKSRTVPVEVPQPLGRSHLRSRRTA